MKKLYYFPIFFLSITAMFVISCTKESAYLSSDFKLPPEDQVSAISQVGSMVDLGLINPDTRVMLTTLNAQNFSLSGDNVDISGTTATFNLTYYVNKDAQIPEGEYSFSDSDSKLPFTFDSAVFGGGVDSNGYSIPPEKIVDGSVTVTQDGNSYLFQIQGHLESGTIFSGSTKGSLHYADNDIYTKP
jgi:hypothetical protein